MLLLFERFITLFRDIFSIAKLSPVEYFYTTNRSAYENLCQGRLPTVRRQHCIELSANRIRKTMRHCVKVTFQRSKHSECLLKHCILLLSAAASRRSATLLLPKTRPTIPQIRTVEDGNRLASTAGASLPRRGVTERN